MDAYMKLFNDIHDEVANTDAIDVHTHIDWDRPQAQTPVPILFYHFVHFEMKAAGLAQWTDHIRDANVADVAARAKAAIPYYDLVRLGGSYYCLKRILQDLYGMKTDVPTEAFIDELVARVEANKNDRQWPRDVLAKAHIKRASVNILDYKDWPAKMKTGNEDTKRYADLFFPAIEQGAFVLFGVGQVIRTAASRSGIPVTDADSLVAAIRAYASREEWDSIKSFLGWATIDFMYKKVDKDAAAAAIKKHLAGQTCSTEENCAVQVLAVSAVIAELTPRKIPYQFFFGSEFTPGHREPAIASFRDQTLLNFCAMATDYPDQQFELLLGVHAYAQEANIMTKCFPNIRVGGIWWHNMYPAYIRRIIAERMDVCPLNKVNAFFSDAYCVEWAYGKRMLVQREFAHVLAEKINTGYFSRNDASEIIRKWWWENPVSFYGLDRA